MDMIACPSPTVVDWASHLPLSPTCTGGRNLLDVRARLQHNASMQHLITREAEDVELDMMKQDMANKGKVGHVVCMWAWHGM